MIEIYTDGSCKQGRGAWAFVIVQDGVIITEAAGMERRTNSLHMELRAAIEALSSMSAGSIISLYSDARILIDAMTGIGKPLTAAAHLSELAQLRDLDAKHRVAWTWVKAHAGHIYNERCDELCVIARRHQLTGVR